MSIKCWCCYKKSQINSGMEVVRHNWPHGDRNGNKWLNKAFIMLFLKYSSFMNYGLKITPCTPFANLIGEGYELKAIVSKFYASRFFQGCVLAPLENRLTTFNHVEMTCFACTHKVSTTCLQKQSSPSPKCKRIYIQHIPRQNAMIFESKARCSRWWGVVKNREHMNLHLLVGLSKSGVL